MIRTYYLPVDTIAGSQVVAGIELIHDALVECTEEPMVRRLIQDTTDGEHTALLIYALDWNEATPQELERFNVMPPPIEPSPDYLRAIEILETSPDAITQPEIWELLRIFGRRLGYDF